MAALLVGVRAFATRLTGQARVAASYAGRIKKKGGRSPPSPLIRRPTDYQGTLTLFWSDATVPLVSSVTEPLAKVA